MRHSARSARARIAAALAITAAVFPSAALADDPPAADAPAADPPAPACLPAKGLPTDGQSLRGVRVGTRAMIRTTDGTPLRLASLSYCVTGGGDFTVGLTDVSDIVLVTSTADGDAIGPINPSSPARSARLAFPKMKKIARTDKTTVYRVDNRRQLLIGVAGGRVSFVAAADRLLLQFPRKLTYYLHRLDF
jgi:hypothetical protein